jgi:hypothetical protein
MNRLPGLREPVSALVPAAVLLAACAGVATLFGGMPRLSLARNELIRRRHLQPATLARLDVPVGLLYNIHDVLLTGCQFGRQSDDDRESDRG